MVDPREAQSERPGKADNESATHDEHQLKFALLGKSIFDSLPVGVVSFGPDLKIINANSHAVKLIKLGEKIDKSLAKGTDSLGITGPNWTKELKSALSTGKPCGFDYVMYTLNSETRLLRIVCTPLKRTKTSGNLGGTVIIEDITEKVYMEEQLANTERLAAVGKLASKVAHELNNPMDGILRYINLAIRIIEGENLEKPKEYLTQCRQGLMRMVQIVSELLEFSRGAHTPFESLRVEHIIEDAIKAMSPIVEASKVQILRDYAPGIPQIRSGNLFQVFCNLIKNALDAMPDGGKLSVSTRLGADNTAIVAFRDTGTGFVPENGELIFEPFFTTKGKGRGTGLGLAISKDIVERYHGRITAENAPGGGSIFTVHLPVVNRNL